MSLSRWKISAAVLLLAIGMGSALRLIGDGESGYVVVEGIGLFLLYTGLGLFMLQIAALIIGPVTYLVVTLLGGNPSVQGIRNRVMIVDILYLSYMAQILFVTAFHIFHTIESVDQGDPYATGELFGTLPALGMFLWLIIFVRWRFFLRMMPRDWRRIEQQESENNALAVQIRVVPFVAVTLTGWLGSLLVAAIYSIWLA